MIPKPLVGGLAAVAAIGFAILVVLSEMRLGYGEGLLDGRMGGYDVQAVRDYLTVLPPDALTFYIGTFRVMDTVIPPLIALALAAVIWSSSGRILRVLVLLPVLYVGCDLYENALVARVLAAGIDGLNAADVAAASQMTMAKWAFTLASLAAAILTWRKTRGAS